MSKHMYIPVYYLEANILILKKIVGYYLIQFFFTIYFKLKMNKEKMCNYALKIMLKV